MLCQMMCITCRCRRGLVTAANFLVWLWETPGHSGAVLGWTKARARQVACGDKNMAMHLYGPLSAVLAILSEAPHLSWNTGPDQHPAHKVILLLHRLHQVHGFCTRCSVAVMKRSDVQLLASGISCNESQNPAVLSTYLDLLCPTLSASDQHHGKQLQCHTSEQTAQHSAFPHRPCDLLLTTT